MSEKENDFEIDEYFHLPIFYNSSKQKLSDGIVKDLELVEVTTEKDKSENEIQKEKGDMGRAMYDYVFYPENILARKIVPLVSKYYTDDISFLKDTQHVVNQYAKDRKGIKKVSPENQDKKQDKKQDKNKYDDILGVWKEITNETGFREKYYFVEWPWLEELNKSEFFLQFMSIYNLASPVLSLLVPIFILIIPFFIIQMKGLNLNVQQYIEILKILASQHAVGKMFTHFHTVSLENKMYLLVSLFFYLFSFYQNVMICFKFNQNMIKIHQYMKQIEKYIEDTETSFSILYERCQERTTYLPFLETAKAKVQLLSQYKNKINKIGEYKWNKVKKIGEIGYVLKYFYEFYDSKELKSAFLYSFGLNGYIDLLQGVGQQIAEKTLHFATFHKKTKKNKWKQTVYPPLAKVAGARKNDVYIKTNKIITGPNASGKTTVLKTNLINILLTQQFGCGFYTKALVNPYTFIHCYLNIPDTSGRDSLFQAEARRCKEIIQSVLEHSNDRHFCIFDELFSGTNPEEAQISASAFMEYLVKNKKVDCLLTTHFFAVCKNLEKNTSIENLHMETETIETVSEKGTTQKIKYTYALRKGICEKRGGMHILKEMDYPEEIINTML